MKCGALVRYEQRKTKCGVPKFKKNGDPMMRQTHCITPYSVVMHSDLMEGRPKSDFTVCQGKIKVKLEEGYSCGYGCDCGYMSTDFDVSYQCEECNNSYFPELPSSLSELQEFLEDTIGDFSGAKRKRLLDDKVTREKKWEEEQNKWFAENT